MIGIIGAGTMGKGIAIEFAKNNYKVVLISAQRHLDCPNIMNEVEKVATKFKQDNIENILSNIHATNDYKLLQDCNLIIEAVSEDLDVKHSVIKEAIKHTSDECAFASNTSSLSIRAIFEGLVNLSNVIGLHFFNPVQIMKLVELSYLEETAVDRLY